MRFVVLKDDFYPGDIPFLESARVIGEGDEIVYEVSDAVQEKLKVLEEAGFVKTVKGSIDSIRSGEDVIRLTERVEVLQGGTVLLRVILGGHELEFSEDELLSPMSLRKRLLRLKAIVHINGDKWEEILRFWFSIASDVKEISEADEVREEILTFLRRCVIYEDIGKSAGRTSLFYDRSDPSVVLCRTENLKQLCESRYTQRKIRWLLSEYIDGESVQRSVGRERHRFWRISIKKAGIDLKAQTFSEEDKSLIDVVKEKVEESDHADHEDKGISWIGKDNVSEE